MAIVDITGLDQVEVFRRLYNRAKPLGMGMLHYVPGDMSVVDATRMFSTYVDYCQGRVMKITFKSLEGVVNEINRLKLPAAEIAQQLPAEGVTHFFDSWLYNRDNGDNAAEQVVQQMRTELARS